MSEQIGVVPGNEPAAGAISEMGASAPVSTGGAVEARLENLRSDGMNGFDPAAVEGILDIPVKLSMEIG